MRRTYLKGCAAGLASLLVITIAPAVAAPPLCPPIRYLDKVPTIPPEAITENAPIQVRADRVDRTRDGRSVFSGHVELRYTNQTVFADQIIYDPARDEFQATGNVTLLTADGNAVETPLLVFHPKQQTGYTGRAVLIFGAQNARGSAKSIIISSRTRTELKGARYTTCPPGHDGWVLSGSDIKLNHQTATGSALNALVRFKGVPVFYVPYFSFPITNQRKTGFLMPRIGVASRSGFFVATPYYFNILPNLDATLTPRWLTNRGLLTAAEGRYLMPSFNGSINVEYIGHDRMYGAPRYAATLIHNQVFSPEWWGDVNVNKVSDSTYFSDFSDSTAQSSQTHVPQRADLNYAGSIWQISTRLFAYQTIDTTIPVDQRPYRRLPQILFNADPPFRADGPRYGLAGEFVNFERDGSVSTRRLDLAPSIGIPWRNAYAYATPKVTLRNTSYQFSAGGPGSTLTRTLPMVSLDSGLELDRTASIGGRDYTQTLEPRFFYLYVPYRNQDTIPLFDSAVPDLSFYNLFRENRYIGADRIGDANQATLALTSRLLDPQGVERVRGSIGEVFYFQDRRVTLPGETLDNRRVSDLVGEVQALLAPRWFARSTVQWDPSNSVADQSAVFLQYHPDADKIINVGHLYTRGSQNQIDVSAQWPLRGRWTVLARSNYSLRDQMNLDSYAGVQYRSCCWAMRLYDHRRVTPPSEQVNTVMFEFELTGLGTFGEAPLSPLRQNAFMLTQ